MLTGAKKIAKLGGIGAAAIGAQAALLPEVSNAVSKENVQPREMTMMRFDLLNKFPDMGEISQSEISASLDTITSAPEMLLSVLPPQLPKSYRMEALDRIESMLNNPDVIAAVMKNFERHNNSIPMLSSESAELTASQKWNQLCDLYPCSVCLDVLAAPTVLSCSHNICGSCFEGHREHCKSHKLPVTCPTCRLDVVGEPCYERMLDEMIVEAVHSTPDCALKEEWEERRAEYMDLLAAPKAAPKVPENQTGFDYSTSIWVMVIVGIMVGLIAVIRARR